MKSALTAQLLIWRNYFYPVVQIARKEWRGYFQSWLAWIVMAVFLLICGLLGYWGMRKEPASNQALQFIFYGFSGATMTIAVLIAMRSFAEERAMGTLELLITAPITEGQIVLGKVLSAAGFMLVWIFSSLPIPLMVAIFGEVTWGHILSGYIGVLLIGISSASVTIFYSTLTGTQLLAAVMGGTNVIIFLLLGFFSPYIDPPMKMVMREFSFYVHYMDFEKGVIVLRHLVFFLSIIIFYNYLAVMALQSRKWK